LTLPLATCEWISTPPGITIMPRASMTVAVPGTVVTMVPLSMQMSRTSPSTPFAGS
jgi:hypothetical protein